MDANATGLENRNAVRDAIAQTRGRPVERAVVVARFDSGGEFDAAANAGSIEFIVEATSPGGELAEWLDDAWWTAALQQWSDRTITLHISPTPGGLLHPVVQSHLEMVRRVSPNWRIVGHACLSDLAGDNVASRLAVSPYHEVRFVDQSQPGSASSEGPAPLVELFGLIRREQDRHGVSSPILVRLPSDADLPHA